MLGEYVGTREAAKLLGVSEASVRRWSDAGLIASYRVGRRGERRFARSDVLGLKSPVRHTLSDSTTAVVLEGSPIPLHSHLCSFYTSDRGRLRLGAPFLRDGIAAGQACILMASQDTARLYERELEAEGMVVSRALESGRLEVLNPFRTGDEGIDAFERSFSAITRRGGVLIRVLGEAAQNRDAMGSVSDLLGFEERFNTLMRRFPVVTLCQYDARRFGGVDIIGALKAHSDNFDQTLGMFLN